MYATIDDFRRQLSDLFGDIYVDRNGATMEWEMEQDLEAASTEIDATVGVRYQIPVTAVSALPMLRTCCVTLAEELAWSRSGRPDVPEHVKKRVDNTRRMLAKIAGGDMVLPGAAEAAVGGAGSAVIVDGPPPEFTRQKLGRFGGV